MVIAGAGSGKTNTLAHRVAHLIAYGADPGKILLLTFSRRAAVEMTRRVDRIIGQLVKGHRGCATASLAWPGTVGARLLREYAGRIGLAPGFTIHDREDSADLLNLVRHELGLSGKDKRFPLKSTCLGIYSAVINTQVPLKDVLQASYPWCAQWEPELKQLFLGYVEAKQHQQVLDYDDLLLYWARMVSEWYRRQMDRLYEDAVIREQDIEQLARIAATYPNQERFLTEFTLDPPDATSDEAGVPLLDEDYLILSTIHSAKGQEWTAVTLLNAVDGSLPSDMATGSPAEIEEERRLLYVAMTRAKDSLDLMVPQRFYVSQQSGMGDRHVYSSRTRFIPNALLAHFDQVSWPLPEEPAQADLESSRRAVDLAAQMRAMWT